MNRKLVPGLLFAVMFSALLLWAGDPWKEKPYTEWGEKDIEKVLGNSPWARKVRLPRTSAAGGVPRSGDPRAEGAGSGSVGSSRDGGIASRTTSGRSNAKPFYVVQWASSLTVRRALVRQQQMQREIDPQEIERFLSQQMQHHELVVTGAGMRGFQGLDEDAILAATHLEARSSKKKVSPEKVELILRGERIMGVRYFFPREVDGESLIGAEERRVRFSFKTKKASIRADFDLRKMVVEDGRDI